MRKQTSKSSKHWVQPVGPPQLAAATALDILKGDKSQNFNMLGFFSPTEYKTTYWNWKGFHILLHRLYAVEGPLPSHLTVFLCHGQMILILSFSFRNHY